MSDYVLQHKDQTTCDVRKDHPLIRVDGKSISGTSSVV